MMNIPEDLKKQLPEDFDDKWEFVKVKDIKVNDYISYWPKPRQHHSRDSKTKNGLVGGGYVTFLPDEEKKKLSNNDENIFGMRMGKNQWTVAESRVYFFVKSKKDTEAILKKGYEKSAATRAANHMEKAKADEETLKQDIIEAQKLSKSDKIRKALEDADSSEQEPPKKTRGRPAKAKEPEIPPAPLPVESSPPKKTRGRPKKNKE